MVKGRCTSGLPIQGFHEPPFFACDARATYEQILAHAPAAITVSPFRQQECGLIREHQHFEIIMAFIPNYLQKLTHSDRARYEKKVEECGCDPYDLVMEDLSGDSKEWPAVTDVDRMEYLVFRTNFTTKDAMKNYKGLDAHNFFVSGMVFPPRSKILPGDRVLLLGKCHHSQRHTLDPLRLWILAEKNGNILTGHCSCMAGLSETCSHVAATIYLLEFNAKAEQSISCTDQLSGWLPPTMSRVPVREVRDMDFSSAKSKLKRLESLVAGNDPTTTPAKRQRRTSLPAMPSAQWMSGFHAALSRENPIAAGLSLQKDFCGPFMTATSSPLDLTKLYDSNKEDLSYSELIEHCKGVMAEMKITKNEISTIEKKTQPQSASIMWHLYRLGRITGSMAHKVWQGNVNNPAKTTWQTICKGKSIDSQRRLDNNPDIKRGRIYEETARQQYESSQQESHQNFQVRPSGLILHPDHPFIGSSPDGVMKCDCCQGFGCLEIKCPRVENITSCLDANGQLLETHDYFYQVHMHMLVIGASYADLYLWVEGSEPKLIRITRNEDLIKKMILKFKDYFMYVILPEMVAHWFSRNSRQPLGNSVNNLAPTSQLPNICYCQQPRRDPMIICSGLKCTFKEFHCRCVDVSSASTRKKWFCTECIRSAPPPRRRRAVTVNDENLDC